MGVDFRPCSKSDITHRAFVVREPITFISKCGLLTILKDSGPKRLGRLLPLDFDALSQVSTYNIVFSCVKDHKSERSLYCLFRIVTLRKKTST